MLRLILAEHGLIVAEVVLDELERILAVKLRLPAEVAQEIFALLREHPVQPRPEFPSDLPIRDLDDAWALASALAAGAEGA